MQKYGHLQCFDLRRTSLFYNNFLLKIQVAQKWQKTFVKLSVTIPQPY